MYCCNKIFVKTQTTGDTSRVISPKSRTEHVTCVCSAREERQLVFRKFNPPGNGLSISLKKYNFRFIFSCHLYQIVCQCRIFVKDRQKSELSFFKLIKSHYHNG